MVICPHSSKPCSLRFCSSSYCAVGTGVKKESKANVTPKSTSYRDMLDYFSERLLTLSKMSKITERDIALCKDLTLKHFKL